MGKNYFEKYKDIYNKTIEACNSIAANNELGDDLSSIISQLSSISYDWCGKEEVNFEANLKKIIGSLTSLSTFANEYFNGGPKNAYDSLKEQLELLRQTNNDLQNLYNNEPMQRNFKKYDFFLENGLPVRKKVNDVSAYNKAYLRWVESLKTYSNKCQEMEDNIDYIINYLKSLNGIDVLSNDISGLQFNKFIVSFDTGDFNISDYNILDENTIDDEYGRLLTEEELEEVKEQLGIPLETDVTVYTKTILVNGVEFPSYYVFDNSTNPEDLDIIKKKVMKQAQDTIDYTSETISNRKILIYMSKLGYKFVFDQTPECDVWSSTNAETGDKEFYGGSWCLASSHLIKVHYWPYLDDKLNVIDEGNKTYVNELLLHELGHAFDGSTPNDDEQINYYAKIQIAYEQNRPLYVRIAGSNDGYKQIYYEDSGIPYVLDNNDNKIYFPGNQVSILIETNEFSYTVGNTVEMNETSYIVANIGDTKVHCSEIAAEVYRWSNVDPGHILEACENDDSYQMVADCILKRMEENFGEDISWWTTFY